MPRALRIQESILRTNILKKLKPDLHRWEALCEVEGLLHCIDNIVMNNGLIEERIISVELRRKIWNLFIYI
jgi:hypothetical protein